MNIYEKIQQARVELQKSGLKKSGHNKFAGFDYFELKDFLPRVNTIFGELKLFSKFDLTENEGILTIINSENLEEKETFVTPIAKIEMKGQNVLQQIGSTHTYLKRYCYYNALEIIANDDFEPTIDKEEYEKAIKAINTFHQFFERELSDFLLINNAKQIADLEPFQVIKFKKFMHKKAKNDSELAKKIKKFSEKGE